MQISNAMIDKLKCDIPSMELMDYIGVVESLYLSDPTLIDVPIILQTENRPKKNWMKFEIVRLASLCVWAYSRTDTTMEL